MLAALPVGRCADDLDPSDLGLDLWIHGILGPDTLLRGGRQVYTP